MFAPSLFNITQEDGELTNELVGVVWVRAQMSYLLISDRCIRRNIGQALSNISTMHWSPIRLERMRVGAVPILRRFECSIESRTHSSESRHIIEKQETIRYGAIRIEGFWSQTQMIWTRLTVSNRLIHEMHARTSKFVWCGACNKFDSQSTGTRFRAIVKCLEPKYNLFERIFTTHRSVWASGREEVVFFNRWKSLIMG